MPEDRAQAFLQMIRRSQKGRLKVYLGYGPGVGKTYQMLQEAHRLKKDGIDVVVGLVETHGRVETAQLLEGLEIIPRRHVEYRTIDVEEMDVDAIIARKPQVVVVDELAHTNVPGSRNDKRYQDVQDILAAGIHVISAMNVQHLESLYNTVEQLIGVTVRERLPDSVLAEADQIVNIDLAAEDLQKRLRDGKIYPRERVATSLENFFTASNLEHLRELALRELASQIDSKRRESTPDKSVSNDGAPDQIMVCLSSRGPNSARLLRFASRLAGRLNRNWYAVYVQTPSEEPTVIDAQTQRLLSDTLTLANQLGAMVFTFKGQDVADTILTFAREYRVGQVVIGRPRPIPWWRKLRGEKSVAEQLINRSKGVTVVVVDADSSERLVGEFIEPTESAPTPVKRGTLSRLLTEQRIAIWEDPASRSDIRNRLAEMIALTTPSLTKEKILQKLGEREQQGSTFLNEGVALPHARFDELMSPQVALALTHGGVLDAPTDKPVEVVFLLLSPTSGANIHLQMLGKVGRAMQNRDLRRSLSQARTPAEALGAIQDYEAAVSGK
ncbi:MAG TPA: PTS sugar transporter subunit IIA [Tepidisphaeraceae bacterium]|nr:PTS sugar transporter subunit IIA [Tepidisphaeraceae bacterium]